MGMIVSSAVAAGPAVISDLETPYAVLQDRRRREREQEVLKARTRRTKSSVRTDQRLVLKAGCKFSPLLTLVPIFINQLIT